MNHPRFSRYSIFQTGGKQYQAIEGKTIAIEKLPVNAGDRVEFAEVLLRKEAEGAIAIGQPFVEKPVIGVALKHDRGEKITVFKMKRRKGYRKMQGHRQSYTVVRIESI